MGCLGTLTSFFAALVLLEYTFLYLATLITILTKYYNLTSLTALGKPLHFRQKLVDLISI